VLDDEEARKQALERKPRRLPARSQFMVNVRGEKSASIRKEIIVGTEEAI
jgi:hypothetical protein